MEQGLVHKLWISGKLDRAFDVVVGGGGHAGIEAALAAARMGCSVLLVTMDRNAIGRMSCNPAIGGSAKGQIVREIDALGGVMGKIADETGIQFRILNRSKGPAVWAPRSQNDRELYSKVARRWVEESDGVTRTESTVVDVHTSESKSGRKHVVGVTLQTGERIACSAFILCAGTFMRGLMHTGMARTIGGRYGEAASTGLTESLERLGFVSGRLKTGTPPRIDFNSIDLSSVEVQPSDDPPQPFSFQNEKLTNRLIPMYLTFTNTRTHEILRTGFNRSPLFTGTIKGVGPRYCPSIEDKIVRFSDKDHHQIFLEPEGYDTNVVYVNGYSTSLPEEVQLQGLRSIAGLEHVTMLRPGYAVEYDFFPPHQIHLTMETKPVEGLFFAGQVNGTSGYEEAAGQGLLAGINAALRVKGGEPFILKRSEAYIGVLADDLVNKSTEEPYRMFTSRAEHRLLLRQDNADRRLMSYGKKFGLIPEPVYERLLKKEELIATGIDVLRSVSASPAIVNNYLVSKNTDTLSETVRLYQLVKRPEVSLEELLNLPEIAGLEYASRLRRDVPGKLAAEAIEQIEIETKYEGYIQRQKEIAASADRYEQQDIPLDFDFTKIKALSSEAREKFSKVKPTSIGQASRISGVTPSDISVLMVYLRG